ncbi:stress response protein NST1 [Ceratobasidium sp. AG-Ba]|nr:stress response protein NST1 [Ceratobasidium sp. AG-Ba]
MAGSLKTTSAYGPSTNAPEPSCPFTAAPKSKKNKSARKKKKKAKSNTINVEPAVPDPEVLPHDLGEGSRDASTDAAPVDLFLRPNGLHCAADDGGNLWGKTRAGRPEYNTTTQPPSMQDVLSRMEQVDWGSGQLPSLAHLPSMQDPKLLANSNYAASVTQPPSGDWFIADPAVPGRLTAAHIPSTPLEYYRAVVERDETVGTSLQDLPFCGPTAKEKKPIVGQPPTSSPPILTSPKTNADHHHVSPPISYAPSGLFDTVQRQPMMLQDIALVPKDSSTPSLRSAAGADTDFLNAMLSNERIKELWFGLSEKQRQDLVDLPPEDLFKKMKEQQSGTSCRSKRYRLQLFVSRTTKLTPEFS